MDYRKIVITILAIAAYTTEASLHAAPAVALPPPIRYAQFAPYNVAPFAASISTFTRTLALPPPPPPLSVLPAQYALHAPVGAPVAAPAAVLPAPAPVYPYGAPLVAPGPFVPGAGPLLPGAGPVLPGALPVARSLHPAGPAPLLLGR